MSSEGIHVVLDLRYVRRLVQLSRDAATFLPMEDADYAHLITAVRVLDRLIDTAEEEERNRSTSNGATA